MNRLLVILSLVLCFTGCMSTKARDEGLLPATRMAWTGVRADIELGIDDAVAAGVTFSAPLLREYIARIDQGLESGNRADFTLVSWESLEPYAQRGIKVRVTKQEISPLLVPSFQERLRNFGWALAKLQQTFVRYGPSRETEYWLSRGGRSTAAVLASSRGEYAHAQ